MPIRHNIIHQIDKKPGGTPAVLHVSSTELIESQVTENLLHDFNEAYNAKQGKGWSLFHPESGAYPFSGWMKGFYDGGDFIEFSLTAVEHLTSLMEKSNLSVGGNVLFAHFQQGLTDYMIIGLLQHSESITVSTDLSIKPSKHLDFGSISLAARINLSEWSNNPNSRQYISFVKSKNCHEVLGVLPRLHPLQGLRPANSAHLSAQARICLEPTDTPRGASGPG